MGGSGASCARPSFCCRQFASPLHRRALQARQRGVAGKYSDSVARPDQPAGIIMRQVGRRREAFVDFSIRRRFAAGLKGIAQRLQKGYAVALPSPKAWGSDELITRSRAVKGLVGNLATPPASEVAAVRRALVPEGVASPSLLLPSDARWWTSGAPVSAEWKVAFGRVNHVAPLGVASAGVSDALQGLELSRVAGLVGHSRPAVAVLSDQGLWRLRAQAPQDMDRLAASLREGVQGLRRTTEQPFTAGSVRGALGWADGDIERVLIDRRQYPAFMRRYRESVRNGTAPSSVHGKPYTAFFRPSDDFATDLQADGLARLSSVFARRSPEAQRPVAALAYRLARNWEPTVPLSTRLAVAEALITSERVRQPRAVMEALKATIQSERLPASSFFHGTGAGEAIARGGFRVGQGLDGLGRGIYHGNASVGAHYAQTGNDIVSGRVWTGPQDLVRLYDKRRKWWVGAPTRTSAPFAVSEGGLYRATQSPERFQIRRLTRFQPGRAAEALDDVHLTALLRARAQGGDAAAWAEIFLKNQDPARLRSLAQQIRQ